MRYCIYYWLIEPLRGGISDDGTQKACIERDIVWKEISHRFSLFCDENGLPKFASIQIPCLNDEEKIPDEALPLITILREHLLSTLKLTWRSDVRIFPISTWWFWDDTTPKSFSISLEELGEDKFNPSAASAIFNHTLQMRESIRLYIDGIDENIPPQYRYLALYKFLEKKFKYKGDWLKEDLAKNLALFENHYDGLCEKDLINELHSIRDKCAHILTGKGKKESLGVTQLNHDEILRVNRMLPVLTEMCRHFINKDAEGNFALGKKTTWDELISGKLNEF